MCEDEISSSSNAKICLGRTTRTFQNQIAPSLRPQTKLQAPIRLYSYLDPCFIHLFVDGSLIFRKRKLELVAYSLAMGSALFSWALRQLFAPSRGCLHQARPTPVSRHFLPTTSTQRRGYAFGRRRTEKDRETGWQQRIDAFPKDMSKQMQEYPTVTARELRHRFHRPRRVKMLARDFIEG